MDKKVIAGIVVLILIFGGGIFFLNQSRKAAQPGNATIEQSVTQPVTNVSSDAPPQLQSQAVGTPTGYPTVAVAPEVTVTLTANGFDPRKITVKPGTKVIWANKSGTEATVNLPISPENAAPPALNLGKFSDGAMLSLVFNRPGVYWYGDDNNQNHTGAVMVAW